MDGKASGFFHGCFFILFLKWWGIRIAIIKSWFMTGAYSWGEIWVDLFSAIRRLQPFSLYVSIAIGRFCIGYYLFKFILVTVTSWQGQLMDSPVSFLSGFHCSVSSELRERQKERVT